MNMQSGRVAIVKSRLDRRLRNEYLLENIIDDEFEAALFPLSILQSFFLMSRFRIINHFITPDYKISVYIKSFIGLTILVNCHIFRFVALVSFGMIFESESVMFMLRFQMIYFSLILIIIYIVNVLQRDNIVEMLVKLQSVLNQMNIDKKAFLGKQKMYNWTGLLIVLSFHIAYCIVVEKEFLKLLGAFMSTVTKLFLDMQIVIVTCTIVWIKNELVAWNYLLKEKIKMYAEEGHEKNPESKTPIFNAYVDIVRTFCLCNKLYQLTFTCFGLEIFTHLLINLEYILEFAQMREGNLAEIPRLFGLAAVWNVKNYMLIVMLSIACEMFYKTVKNTESTCIQVLQNYEDTSTGMRKTCKNVLRLNRAALHKMSAYGAFEIDATFPLRLFSVLVSYTVVLLQKHFRALMLD